MRRSFRRRGPKLPVRWLEANVNTYATTDQGVPLPGLTVIENVVPTGNPASPRVLIWGDDDLEYMDANESILERTVGQISLECSTREDLGGALYMPLPVVRMGLLVSDDVEDQTLVPNIDLWERESIEEHRWLWLHQVGQWERVATNAVGTDFYHQFRADLAIDSSVHRKLGKKDALLLYAQWAIPVGFGAEPDFDLSVRYVENIRCLMKTK